jgi:hypothetical protein
MNRRLFRRMMRNHERALRTLLSANAAISSPQRNSAEKYLADYPVERIIDLAYRVDEQPETIMTRRRAVE